MGGDPLWAQAIGPVWLDLAARPGCGYMHDMCISSQAVDLLGDWMQRWLTAALQEAGRLAQQRAASSERRGASLAQISPEDFRRAVLQKLNDSSDGMQYTELRRTLRSAALGS